MPESKDRTIARLRGENAGLRAKVSELETRLAYENSLWGTPEGRERHSDPRPRELIHRFEGLDDAMSSPTGMRAATGCSRAEFDLMLDMFTHWIADGGRSMLFRIEGDGREHDAGNRCLLHPRHVLFMALKRMRQDTSQEGLESEFGVDQSTVSRYVALVDRFIDDALPTARSMSERIRAARTRAEFEELVPDSVIIMDGTNTPAQRPGDPEERREKVGRQGKYTNNTVVTINKRGESVGISETRGGSVHDLRLIREDPPDFGRWTGSLAGGGGRGLKAYSDKGFIGLVRDWPGVEHFQPERKPKGGALTRKQRARNRVINTERMPVEGVIGLYKCYRIITNRFHGTTEQFNDTLNRVTGLVNFRLMYREISREWRQEKRRRRRKGRRAPT